jgi:hypothetical protein
MKLSIFAVSALVLSTSFGAVGWADEHQPEVDPGAGEPGAGGAELGDLSGRSNRQLSSDPGALNPGAIGATVVPDNIAGTPAGQAPEEPE